MTDEFGSMKSRRSYLLKPYYDWLVDSGRTPYILVEVIDDNVQVPDDYVRNDEIVLGIAPNSVRDFHLDDQWLTFSASFSGTPYAIQIPLYAIRGIFDKETQQEGIFFDDVDDSAESSIAAHQKGFTKLK